MKNDRNNPKNVLKVLNILTIQSGKNCPISIPTMMAIINLGTKPNFLVAIMFPPLKKYKYFIFIQNSIYHIYINIFYLTKFIIKSLFSQAIFEKKCYNLGKFYLWSVEKKNEKN